MPIQYFLLPDLSLLPHESGGTGESVQLTVFEVNIFFTLFVNSRVHPRRQGRTLVLVGTTVNV